MRILTLLQRHMLMSRLCAPENSKVWNKFHKNTVWSNFFAVVRPSMTEVILPSNAVYGRGEWGRSRIYWQTTDLYYRLFRQEILETSCKRLFNASILQKNTKMFYNLNIRIDSIHIFIEWHLLILIPFFFSPHFQVGFKELSF